MAIKGEFCVYSFLLFNYIQRAYSSIGLNKRTSSIWSKFEQSRVNFPLSHHINIVSLFDLF